MHHGEGPVFLVVGDTARSAHRSGIQTVVRSLAAGFAERRAPVRPVIWNGRLRLLRPLPPELEIGPGAEPLRDPARWLTPSLLRRQPLAWWPWLCSGGKGKNLPIHRHPLHRLAPPGTWILQPELMFEGKLALLKDYAHRHGWRLAAILHDTIAVDHPEFVAPGLPEVYGQYLRELAGVDLILPVSETSATGWGKFVARTGLASPPVHPCTLACDLAGTPRVQTPLPVIKAPDEPVRMLCVSTLEPRKNHGTLLAAYERLRARRPDLRAELHLVGAPYAGSPDIAEQVRASTQKIVGIHWHEQVEPVRLQALYQQCDFTVYPSVLEGFGLPVIESLWMGRPCLCANFGVMAENAAGGGCLTTDVRDPEALADAMAALAESPELRHRLSVEATARPLKTWGEYADEISACLAQG